MSSPRSSFRASPMRCRSSGGARGADEQGGLPARELQQREEALHGSAASSPAGEREGAVDPRACSRHGEALELDRGDGHFDAAFGAEQGIDFQDSPQQSGPGGAAAFVLGRQDLWRILLGALVPGRAAGTESPCGAGALGVSAIVAYDVLAAVGDLAGDGVDPLGWVESELGRAASRVRRRGDPDSALVGDLDWSSRQTFGRDEASGHLSPA